MAHETHTITLCLTQTHTHTILLFFFFLQCGSWLLRGLSFPLYDLALLSPAYSELWHLRATLERERWQKDGWPRYFRTQLLLLPHSANTGACIRPEEACVWRGGETISSVTNLVFTPGQEGKVIHWPPPPSQPHTPLHPSIQSHTQNGTHTRNPSVSAIQTLAMYEKRFFSTPKWHRAVRAWLYVEFTVACESPISSDRLLSWFWRLRGDLPWPWYLLIIAWTDSVLYCTITCSSSSSHWSFDKPQCHHVWFILRPIQFN